MYINNYYIHNYTNIIVKISMIIQLTSDYNKESLNMI